MSWSCLDFIIYSFLLRLYRDYRDYDALIMFNFHLFKKLNGSVFFREVLFLKFLTFKYFKLQQCWSKCVLNFYRFFCLFVCFCFCFVFVFVFLFFLVFQFQNFIINRYKLEGREAYIQGAYNRMYFYVIFLHVDGPTLERRGGGGL